MPHRTPKKMHDFDLGVTIVSEQHMKKNLFYCKNEAHEDRIALDSDESLLCALCGDKMELTGWLEGVSDQYLDEVDSSEGE